MIIAGIGPETLSAFSEDTFNNDSLNLDDISLHHFDGKISDVSNNFKRLWSAVFRTGIFDRELCIVL